MAAAHCMTLVARPSAFAAVVLSRCSSSSPQVKPLKCTSESSSSSPSSAAAHHPLHLVGRRHCLTALTLCFSGNVLLTRAAVLEADDDEELLQRVKKDRKKRLQRQGVISSSNRETGYLQELIYKLSKVGQAIDNNDLSSASSILGANTGAEWVQNVNTAFSKLSSSPEEKMELDMFNASLSTLFLSVAKRDVGSSKLAFVSLASALEKWMGLTGLVGQLKGL